MWWISLDKNQSWADTRGRALSCRIAWSESKDLQSDVCDAPFARPLARLITKLTHMLWTCQLQHTLCSLAPPVALLAPVVLFVCLFSSLPFPRSLARSFTLFACGKAASSQVRLSSNSESLCRVVDSEKKWVSQEESLESFEWIERKLRKKQILKSYKGWWERENREAG